MEIIYIVCASVVLLAVIISVSVMAAKTKKYHDEVIAAVAGVNTSVSNIKIPEYKQQKDTVLSSSEYQDLIYEAYRTNNNTVTFDSVIIKDSISGVNYYTVAHLVFNNCIFLNMNSAFYNKSKLESILFNKCKFVGSMYYAFRNTTVLKQLEFTDCDTKEVTDLRYAFAYTNALTSLDLSCFDTSGISGTYMTYVFYNAQALQTLKLPEKFIHSKITSMDNMFYNNKVLKELDVSGFDTSGVTTFKYAFYGTPLNELDISNFTFSNTLTTTTTNMIDINVKQVKIKKDNADLSGKTLKIKSIDGKKSIATAVPIANVVTV